MKQEQLNSIKATVENEQTTILNFFKSRFPLYHNSNVFFRDMQFTIDAFFELKGSKLGYTECEQITKHFFEHLLRQNMVIPVSVNGYKLNNPQYKTGAPAAEAVQTV